MVPLSYINTSSTSMPTAHDFSVKESNGPSSSKSNLTVEIINCYSVLSDPRQDTNKKLFAIK